MAARGALDKALRAEGLDPTTAEEWDGLAAIHDVGDTDDLDEDDLSELLHALNRWRLRREERGGTPEPARRTAAPTLTLEPSALPPDALGTAITAAVAAVAREQLATPVRRWPDGPAVGFREALGLAGPLTPEQVTGWVRERLPPGTVEEEHYPADRIGPATLAWAALLDVGNLWGDTGNLWGVRIASPLIGPGYGALGLLADEARRLAHFTGWAAWEATMFVLTDEAPARPSIAVQWSIGGADYGPGGPNISGQEWAPVRRRKARVELSVHPYASPDAVAAAFRAVRQRLGIRNTPAPGPKMLALATFDASRPPGEHTRDRVAAWNALHPDWQYVGTTARSHFARDAKAVRARLLDDAPPGARRIYRMTDERAGRTRHTSYPASPPGEVPDSARLDDGTP